MGQRRPAGLTRTRRCLGPGPSRFGSACWAMVTSLNGEPLVMGRATSMVGQSCSGSRSQSARAQGPTVGRPVALGCNSRQATVGCEERETLALHHDGECSCCHLQAEDASLLCLIPKIQCQDASSITSRHPDTAIMLTQCWCCARTLVFCFSGPNQQLSRHGWSSDWALWSGTPGTGDTL